MILVQKRELFSLVCLLLCTKIPTQIPSENLQYTSNKPDPDSGQNSDSSQARITGFGLMRCVFDLMEIVVLLYLSDVNNFVQLHEEPLNGIINLPNLFLGHTEPS